MAFARSAPPRAPVQRHRHEHVLPLSAPEPRVAMLKDLRKMRKALNEKLEHALALKGDVNSVHQQLRSIGDAFDTLSQVLVDELDYIRGDVARTKVDMVDQMTTLARSVQELSPELAAVRGIVERNHALAEGAHKATHKLKHWSESGFRRLNEAMSVQQQALAVLDGQVTTVHESVQQFNGEMGIWRLDSSNRALECDRLRQELEYVRKGYDGMNIEQKQQLQAMQAAASNYEMAMADKENRSAMQLEAYARAETEMQELRAMFDSRLCALEKSWRRDVPKGGGAQAEARVKDLEFEVGQLRRQVSEQGEMIRDMQKQITRVADKPLAQSRAEQNQLQDLIAKAVHEHMQKNPSLDALTTRGGVIALDSSRRARGSPPREAVEGEDSLLQSPGVVGGALGRVMAASQRRVGHMRHESEMRHAALTRAVEEIDERIRASTT